MQSQPALPSAAEASLPSASHDGIVQDGSPSGPDASQGAVKDGLPSGPDACQGGVEDGLPSRTDAPQGGVKDGLPSGSDGSQACVEGGAGAPDAPEVPVPGEQAKRGKAVEFDVTPAFREKAGAIC